MNHDFERKLGDVNSRLGDVDQESQRRHGELVGMFRKGFGDIVQRIGTSNGKINDLDKTVKRLEENIRQDSEKHQRRYSRLSRRIVVITTELTRGTYEFEFDDDNDSDDSEESPPPPGHTAQNTSTNVTSPIAGPSTATQATPKTGLRSQRSIVSFGKLKIRNLSLPNLSKKR